MTRPAEITNLLLSITLIVAFMVAMGLLLVIPA